MTSVTVPEVLFATPPTPRLLQHFDFRPSSLRELGHLGMREPFWEKPKAPWVPTNSRKVAQMRQLCEMCTMKVPLFVY